MELRAGTDVVTFTEVPLRFRAFGVNNLFARKNNKTLAETLSHRRYGRLVSRLGTRYDAHLGAKLGDFLAALKTGGDSLYAEFLNAYGDLEFCEFGLEDRAIGRLKGLYCFSAGGTLQYIGRSTDCFWKRINQGYGRIHPKNCYVDGQSTNCHLNALIAKAAPDVSCFVRPLDSVDDICRVEASLIRAYNPSWNIQLVTRSRVADLT